MNKVLAQKTFKIIMLLFFTILFLDAESQTLNNNEMIVEGGSKIKVKPDLAIFTLTIEKRDTVEKNVTRLLNIEMDELVKSLYKIGFTKEIIKIADYDISSSLNEENIKKYTATNILKLEFGLDVKLINAFYKEIETAGLKDLDIGFDTKVSESLEKKQD